MKILKNSQFVICATVVAIVVSTFSLAFAWNFSAPAQEVKPVNGSFVFPVSAFADGKAKHFEYKASPNQRIRFFVVKSADGVLRTALDACEVCHRAKKGYVQQGNDMICVNCGLKFRTDKVGEIKGGCNPHPVKGTIQGDQLVISQQEVASGLPYFQ
jgi:uncharacterized membrane protein